MTDYLSLFGSALASIVALTIAVKGWRKNESQHLRNQETAHRNKQADQLAELLELHLAAHADRHLSKHDAKMKAILLTLPGHLATVLRIRLKLEYTMTGVPLDQATAERLTPADELDPGHKWLLFDRSSIVTGRSFECRPEWIEAELAYDIGGLRGGDQTAVLTALSKNARDPKDATVAMLQRDRQTLN